MTDLGMRSMPPPESSGSLTAFSRLRAWLKSWQRFPPQILRYPDGTMRFTNDPNRISEYERLRREGR